MKLIRSFAKNDPSGTLSILTLLAAPIAALLGHPEYAPVFVAIAAAILGLRTQVTPTKKADEEKAKALTTVALEVAKNLDAAIAGGVGEITGQAARVVDEALEAAAVKVG